MPTGLPWKVAGPTAPASVARWASGLEAGPTLLSLSEP